MSELCAYCATHDIRLFNDAAYCVLTHTDDSATLCEVAPDHPELSWCEASTAAKLIGNGTGWYVGAMVGSSDFIAEVAEMKRKSKGLVVDYIGIKTNMNMAICGEFPNHAAIGSSNNPLQCCCHE